MGRTKRRRCKKSQRHFHTCDDSEELVSLNCWLSNQNLKCNKRLVLAVFDDTGRGVLTKKKIKAGEELLNMPLNTTINITTLLMDSKFTEIFFNNEQNCLIKYKKSLSFQSLLAFFLTLHKIEDNHSKWFIYLKSLPKEYTVPYFLPNVIQEHLENRMKMIIDKQKEVITTSYNIFCDILKSCSSIDSILSLLKNNFTLALYEWAYFTVNTRCVFMDLSALLNLKDKDRSILSLLHDNTKIALCPYLDMINHSPKAKNETKLILNNTGNLPLCDIKEELFTDIKFSIYTNNNFEPFTQVFICYGDSYNMKLLTEYGFILPSNELDYIPFEFDTIELYLKEKNMKLSQEQVNFINNHGLNKDLYVDLKGLSFNFYALLMVVKCYYKQNSQVSKIIYSSMEGFSDNSSLIDLVSPFIKEKIQSINYSIRRLVQYQSECCILDNYVEMMSHYVSILERFIKC